MAVENLSQIRADRKTGRVIWEMSPDVAEFYSMELEAGTDRGIAEDKASLLHAAEELQ